MKSKVPVIQQISWYVFIPQIIGLYFTITLGSRYLPNIGPFWWAIGIVALVLVSRNLFTRDHRAGVAHVKRQRFQEAIPRFQQSLDFLDRHPWIDRFRSVLLFSSSAISYREMALANLGFCHSQIGQGEEARRYYEMCLERFPNSSMATAALRLMDSAADIK